MPSLVQGRVIYARVAIPDPQGRNAKPNRPFIVVTNNADIVPGGRVQAVGVTHQLTESPADHYVILPHGRSARSGFPNKCGALCTWLISITEADVDAKGFIRPEELEQIIEKVKRLNPPLHTVP